MKQFIQAPPLKGSFYLLSERDRTFFEEINRHYKILWSHSDNLKAVIDAAPTVLQKEQIVCISPEQRVEVSGTEAQWSALVFNREFYCLELHDSDVSCSGFLFYGTSYNMVVGLGKGDEEQFSALYQTLLAEFDGNDPTQKDMLCTLLKRFIIMATRLARQQYFTQGIGDGQYNTIRTYRMLVEKHFRKEHQVDFYASALNKSPKTISHLFKRYHNTNPLKVIHDRIIQEARSLLYYTEKSSKEISAELGFEEPAHFSRFFKTNEGISPLYFKKAIIGSKLAQVVAPLN